MSQPLLNYVMLLHAHKERTDSINVVQIARQFVSVMKGVNVYMLFEFR